MFFFSQIPLRPGFGLIESSLCLGERWWAELRRDCLSGNLSLEQAMQAEKRDVSI